MTISTGSEQDLIESILNYQKDSILKDVHNKGGSFPGAYMEIRNIKDAELWIEMKRNYGR